MQYRRSVCILHESDISEIFFKREIVEEHMYHMPRNTCCDIRHVMFKSIKQLPLQKALESFHNVQLTKLQYWQ